MKKQNVKILMTLSLASVMGLSATSCSLFAKIKGPSSSTGTNTRDTGTADTGTGTDTNTDTNTSTEPVEILSFSVNESYKDYKTQILDDITGIKEEGGNATKFKRTSFFKNAEGGKDSFKVGNANAFKLKCSGTYLDETGTLVSSNITDITFKLEMKNSSGEYVDVTSEKSTYVSVLGLEFDFTDAAVGHSFRLTVTPDSARYIGTFSDNIEFEVIDAWNVYTVADLAYIDNYDVNSDKISAEDRSIQGDCIVDVWENVRSVEIANKIKGVVLQNNISLTSADLPQLLKWSAAEVEAYKAANEEDFSTWSKNLFKNTESGTRTDAECIALGKEKLEGSLKDYVNIFSRTNGEGESFRVEGNYFSLDVSGVKRIVKFRDKSLVQATSSNGSHSQLFGFPGDGGVGVYSTDCKVPFQFRAQANEILMNNLNFKGNGTRDNNSDNLGGLIGIKTTALHFVATNVNSSDTFITIFSRPSDDDLTQSHTFIDRSRWYDSYSSMLFFHKTSDNNITNSIMQGAGGSLMLLSESGANNHYRHNPTSANVSNSFLESYVNGLESWFVDKSASSYVPMLASYDLGIFEKLRTDYGTSKKYVKVQDGSAYVNMIAISLDGDKPFANTLAQGEPLTGYLSIDDQKVLDYTELNSSTGKLYPYAQTMKGMGQQGLIFNSSAGGLAAAGDTTGNELLGYSSTFASHPYKSNFVSQFAAQNALLGQLANFNMFPASQHAAITGVFRGNGVNNVADEIDANWRDLTSGEYLSITLQADKTQQYLGVVLGYNA